MNTKTWLKLSVGLCVGLLPAVAQAQSSGASEETTTNDIVGGRSTIGVFTPITASLWIERLRREEGATLPPKPAEGPLPPSASAVVKLYNFTTDAQLRELYRNP